METSSAIQGSQQRSQLPCPLPCQLSLRQSPVSIEPGKAIGRKVLSLHYLSKDSWYIRASMFYVFCLHCSHPSTGAPFQWSAIFHKEDINFTHGIHDLGWYESSEKTCVHKLPCKVSCAYCRTPIMDEGRNMILLFPTLINFEKSEDRKNFEIRYTVHS